MNRPGKHAQLKLFGLCALILLARPAEAADPQPVPSVAPTSDVARSGVIAGAALAISQLAIWRNNMPRVLQPGQADPGLGQCEHGIVGCDDDVAGERYLEPPAHRHAVHRRDHRLGQVVEGGKARPAGGRRL